MKLIIYNLESLKSIQKGVPYLRVNSKNGVFSFNKDATDLMGDPSHLLLMQDADNKKDWYVEPIYEQTEGAFIVRKERKSNKSMIIRSVDLAKHLLKSIEAPEHSMKMLISKEPLVVDNKKIFAIITKSAKV
jgi:hypothetical protein